MKQYYQDNKVNILQGRKKYYFENKDLITKRKKEYYLKNKENKNNGNITTDNY